MEKLFLQSKIVIFCCLFVASIAQSTQASSYLGGYAGATLKAPVGARALSLSNAISASSSYASIFHNPATTATRKDAILSAGGGAYSAGRADAFVSGEFRLPPRMGVAAGILYRGTPRMDNLYNSDETPITQRLSAADIYSKIALSYIAMRTISVGAAIGMRYQSLPVANESIDGNSPWLFSIGAFDVAMRLQLFQNFVVALQLSHMGGGGNWQFSDGEFGATVYDSIPVGITVGTSYTKTLLTRPFSWNCDIKLYALKSNFSPLERKTAVISNGFEWVGWKEVTLRAGIGDFALDSDILDDFETYRDNFTMLVSAGIGLDASRITKGLIINYGLSTDKVGAGVNQQLDFVYHF